MSCSLTIQDTSRFPLSILVSKSLTKNSMSLFSCWRVLLSYALRQWEIQGGYEYFSSEQIFL